LIIMWIEKAVNMLMFRKLFITLICIGTICFSFAMVTKGDDKTGKKTIQLSLPPATKKEEIKLSEDSGEKDVSEPKETIQLSLPPATKKEEIKLSEDSEKKDVSGPDKTTIELTTGTREITQESQGEPGEGTHADRQVQVITKYLKRNEFHVYNLPNLKEGEMFYVYVERISGNLDPFTGIAGGAFDAARFEKVGEDRGRQALKTKVDISSFISELLDEFFFAWNDDGGTGYDTALVFPIPADNDYKLVIGGRTHLSTLEQDANRSFGRYRLTIGVNASDVLTGKATPTGNKFASVNVDFRHRVQEVTATLAPEKDHTFFPLVQLDPGETLHAFVEATSGKLKPSLKLRDFGKKVVWADTFSEETKSAQLQYTFEKGDRNYVLHLEGVGKDSTETTGDFRLLVGIDAPEVLQGKARPWGRSIVREPIKVRTAIQLDQITSISQKAQNFNVVGNLFMEWIDPSFAFSPDTCKCGKKVFEPSQFDKFVKENGLLWPRFIFYNQQGKRFSQEAVFHVFPNGKIKYFERFAVTLQAPDFNFAKIPFDPQQFFIRIVCLEAQELYVYTVDTELTKVGQKLGEVEWYITNLEAQISSLEFDEFKSMYSFRFVAKRHLSYFVFRIIVPLLLIVMVSWVTFFLGDYAKRIDVSGGNLLVFVAFNFTIASALPRLGYLTFMDAFLILGFAVTALTVAYNVGLKRLETRGKKDLGHKIDKYFVWCYPVLYAGGLFMIYLYFFH